MATRVLTPPEGASEGQLLELLARTDVLGFTSRRGVEAASAIAPGWNLPAKSIALAAVGPATARALQDLGLTPRWLGDGTGSADLARRLADGVPPGALVSLLRSALADDALPLALAAAGLRVEDVRLYAPCEPRLIPAEEGSADVVVCASPSAARRILAWHPWTGSVAFVALGPTTARALHERGVMRVTTSHGTTVEDLLVAITSALPPAEVPRETP